MVKSKQKRKAQANGSTANPSRKRTRMSRATYEAVCSMMDPFCPAAQGRHSPYGTSQVTIPVTLVGTAQITTNAGGGACFLMQPGPTEECIGIFNSTTSFTANAFNTSVGSFPSVVSDVRVVTAGVRWWNVMPATAGGGAVHVAPLSDCRSILDGGATTYSSLLSIAGTQITDLRESGVFIFKPSSPADVENFNEASTGGSPSGAAQGGWNAVCINFRGPASTTVATVSWVVNYECTIDIQTGFTGTSSIPRNPALILAQESGPSNLFTGSYESFKHYVDDTIRVYGDQFLKTGIKKGVEIAGNAIFPGAGTAIGGIGDILMLTN